MKKRLLTIAFVLLILCMLFSFGNFTSYKTTHKYNDMSGFSKEQVDKTIEGLEEITPSIFNVLFGADTIKVDDKEINVSSYHIQGSGLYMWSFVITLFLMVIALFSKSNISIVPLVFECISCCILITLTLGGPESIFDLGYESCVGTCIYIKIILLLGSILFTAIAATVKEENVLE